MAIGLIGSPVLAAFVESEMNVTDPEPLYDSEYFLDLLSFSPPLEWDWAWAASSSGYRINGASLDRTDLFLESEVRVSRPLDRRETGEGLDFLYELRQRGDKDLDALRQQVGLEAGPWLGLSARLFGEPAFSKENSDIGAGLGWSPLRGVRGHAGVNAVDFNFNQRGKTGQRYRSKPYAYEGGLAYEAGGRRLRASVEYETPLERFDPSRGLAYAYRRTAARLSWDRPGRAGNAGWSASYRYEFKREGKRFSPDPASETNDFRRHVHTFFAASAWPLLGRDTLEAGGLAMLRAAAVRTPNAPSGAARYSRWELQPYGRWRRALKPWAVSETALFLSGGERRRRPSDASGTALHEKVLETKLGLGLDFRFPLGGAIGLYGTLDLDDATRHLWDGGNVRAQWAF